MAYRDDVAYIEAMNPHFVKAVSDECIRMKDVIMAALPTLTELPGNVEWQADTRGLYEKRLKEAINLVEGLHDGLDKAGTAVEDYASAQVLAKARVQAGVTAEDSLRGLIADIVSTQLLEGGDSDVLRQWKHLRSSNPSFPIHREAIDEVRNEADSLWSSAAAAYDDAIRLETDARNKAITGVNAARELLPDFLADSTLSAQIVDATAGPGDTDKVGYRTGPPTAPRVKSDNSFPYDPDVSPTAGDYVSWNEWGVKLRGAQLTRPDLDDSTAAYAHYRDGTGTDMQIDYEEAYTEDSGVRYAVDAEIRSAQNAAERIFHKTSQTSFQLTGDDPTAAVAGTENWEKTLGEYSTYGTAEVVVSGDQATMKVKVHAEDVYNFNAGASDIATGVPDDENGRFSTLGWAKEFRTHGELERTVTWTMGGAPDESVRGGDGTQRDAPGEDRVDGR